MPRATGSNHYGKETQASFEAPKQQQALTTKTRKKVEMKLKSSIDGVADAIPTSLPSTNPPRPLDFYEMTEFAYSQEKALSPEDNRDSSSRQQLEIHAQSAWQLMQQDAHITTFYNSTPAYITTFYNSTPGTTLMEPQDRYDVIPK